MRLINFILIVTTLLFGGCAKTTTSEKLFVYRPGHFVDIAEAAKRGIYEMANGNFKKAHNEFQYALRYNPTNCQLNFLNGLTYNLQGGKGDRKLLELAEVGYKVAIRFCPSDPWPHYYYGLILAKRKQYAKAQNEFCLAAKYNKNKNTQPFLRAYLVASYNNGDYITATKLIRRINQIDPEDKLAKLIKKELASLATEKPNPDKIPWKSVFEKRRTLQKGSPHLKKQLVIDAVIILSQETQSDQTGINLLTGLNLMYGSSTANGLSAVSSSVNSSNVLDFMQTTLRELGQVITPSMDTFPFTKVVTNTITIPSVTYSLNIFNQQAERAEILARPSLLVEDGGKADYFSGEQLILGIQGTQTGTIQDKYIGIKLEISPVFAKDGSIELSVNISRNFLRPVTSVSTTFDQVASAVSLNTKTKVNIRFGETVVLSALTERLQDNSHDSTPILGHIPVLKYLFNQSTKQLEFNNVIVLLTPRPYISFDSDIRNKDIERKLNKIYHRIINPGTGLQHTMLSLGNMGVYRKPVLATATLYDPEFLKKASDEEFEMLTEEVQ